jgi:hypothetical protein
MLDNRDDHQWSIAGKIFLPSCWKRSETAEIELLKYGSQKMVIQASIALGKLVSPVVLREITSTETQDAVEEIVLLNFRKVRYFRKVR